MTQASPDCTVIVPNFNGATMLRQNLASVIKAAQQYPGYCEVLLVDDASTDDSVAYINTLTPAVRLHCHSKNRGFAEAVHSGVAASHSELLMLINTDVQTSPDCIAQLASGFSDAAIFAASPLIVDENQQLHPNTWVRPTLRRGHINSLPVSFNNKDGGLPSSQYSIENTLYCSGGSVMLRRSMFEKLGGFSQLFQPFYSEDFDLGLRAWYQGWASVVNTNARVLHFDKGTIETHFEKSHIKSVQRRNRLLLEFIHLPLAYLLLVNIPFVLLQLTGEMLLCDRNNVHGFLSALKRLPQAYKLRRSCKSNQQLGFNAALIRANASNDAANTLC